MRFYCKQHKRESADKVCCQPPPPGLKALCLHYAHCRIVRKQDQFVSEEVPVAKAPFWVHIDFGSQTQVCRQEERPGSDWVGPFTWGEAKRHIVEAAQEEIRELRFIAEVWRRKRLADFESESE